MDNYLKTSRLKSGFNYRQKGKFDLALKEFQGLLKDYPGDESVLLELGKTYKMMNKCNKALDEFIRLVRINPDNREAIRELGEVCRLNNTADPAIKELLGIIGKNPKNEYALVELSKIYYKINSLDAALNKLDEAYSINKFNSDTLMVFGQVYKAQGEYERAIEKLKEALKIDPDNKDARAELGKVYQILKQDNLAIKEMEMARDISPFDTKIRLNLIELYVQNNKYESSVKEAQETLKVTSKIPFMQDIMLNEIEILQKKTILESRVKRLWVTVTTRCNIKCRTCGLWSSPWDIPKKTADEVMQLYPYLERVVWLGGEVFLYEYFDELFTKASTFPYLSQQVITNGVILNEKWIEKIVKAGAELTVSIDGTTKEVYEYIRRGASFDKLIRNIKLINEFRRKNQSQTKLRLNAVIMKSNYHQLEAFLDLAKEFNFEQVSLMALHYDHDPKENILYSQEDPRVLGYITNAIPKLKEKARIFNIDLDLLLPTLDSKSKSSESGIKIPVIAEEALYCKMPWKYMFICDKGTVYMTGSCLKPIGNIYENSIAEIWNSKEAQGYRGGMLKNQFTGICRPECRTRWEI